MEFLNIGTLKITIERKKIKNMYLKVKADGEITVSAHPVISLAQITQFIKSKQSWVEQKQKQIKQLPSHLLKEDEFLYFGKLLKWVQKIGPKDKTFIDGETLVVYAPVELSHEKVRQAINNWLFKQLQVKIMSYYQCYWPFFQEQGFKSLEIKYRQMKSTWGVCRPSRGSVTFSKQLIHQPPEFIEYVVVHELCHLLQPNHSCHFYELVSILLPDWKAYAKLKV